MGPEPSEQPFKLHEPPDASELRQHAKHNEYAILYAAKPGEHAKYAEHVELDDGP